MVSIGLGVGDSLGSVVGDGVGSADGISVGLFVLGSAKRITNKIPNAPKNPKIPAPPMKATTMEIIPWRLGEDAGLDSGFGRSWL